MKTFLTKGAAFSVLAVLARRGLVAVLVVQFTLMVTSSEVVAASIVWSAPQNIAGDGDVSTNGALIGAFNVGGAGVPNTTVNGVTFAGLPITGPVVTSGNFHLAGVSLGSSNLAFASGPFGLSPAYETLLSSIVYQFAQPFTLTMNGLVPGATYQFQWWSNNNFGSPTDTTATAGNSVQLTSTVGTYGPVLYLPGQFATGTFVADATTSQSITFSTAYFAEVNGFQLRQLAAVPDAGNTLELFVLALLGLVALRRFRIANSIRR